MTVDDVYALMSVEFPSLQTGPRHNPDGWSWFEGKPRRGPTSNRIVRAVGTSGSAAAELKLSVSSRLQKKDVVRTSFDKKELKKLVANERRLFREHYAS